MALPTKEERIRRKKVMLESGINVPNTDDSWGPWWEELWNNAITHTKDSNYYGVPSVWNSARKIFDDVIGNTTYKREPEPIGGTLQATDNSMGALINRTLNNWQHEGDPARDISLFLMPEPSKPVKWGKSIAKAIPSLVKSVPKLFTKEGAKKAGASILKEIPKVGASYMGGKAVDKISEVTTGKSWAENVANKMSNMAGFHIEPIIGEMTNPGYGYGYFVGNNYSNLGRYTLDNLRPWDYAFDKELLGGLFHIFTKPFYKNPPTFFTHRPKWYTSRKGQSSLKDDLLEARFENGANWAGIPESEVPRVHFIKNADGTISPTHIENITLLEKGDFSKPGQTIVGPDDITPGFVGGRHSDYTYLGDDLAGNSLFKYSDRLKLNPLWVLSDKIKNKFNLQPGSKIYNLVHRLGGIDLSPMLGYEPFTIEFIYGKGLDPRLGFSTDATLISNTKRTFTNPEP